MASLVALVVGIAYGEINYDEVEHAHAVWLVGEGLQPYGEFFEVHPPLVWYALQPFTPWLDSPLGLVLLRAHAGLGHLVALFLIALHARVGRPQVPWRWAVVGVLVVIPVCLPYLLEFRVDAWPHAWLLGALLVQRVLWRERPFTRTVVLAVVGTLAVACSPKPAFLLVAVCFVELIGLRRRRRTLARVLVGHAVGISAALVAVILFLLAMGIGPSDAYHLVVTYHALYQEHAGHRLGLVEEVLARPATASVLAAGAVSWVGLVALGRVRLDGFHAGVLLWLVLHAWLVQVPHKQYFAPWFMLGALFVPFAGRVLEGLHRRAGTLVLLALSGAVVLAAGGDSREWVDENRAGEQRRVQWLILNETAPDAHVVASPPLHPIARRDVFYGWVNTEDTAGGYETEDIMRDLDLAPYSARFTAEHFAKELEAHPPAAIVFDAEGRLRLGDEQERLVREYLQGARPPYEAWRVGPYTVLLRNR